MSGVGIVCFAASYAIALFLEVLRFVFKGPLRTFLTLSWVLAGLTAQTVYLYYHHAVLSGSIDGAESFLLVAAWGLVLVYLFLFLFHPKIPFGLVILPLVLLLIGGSVLVPAQNSGDMFGRTIDFQRILRRFHVFAFLLATLVVSVGFVAGVMNRLQERRLRSRPSREPLFKLPTLEWSTSICRQAIGASVFLLAASIFSGFLMKPVRSDFSYWSDPLVLGTLLMFGFLLLFSGILSLKLFKQEGRRIALLTLTSFLFLVSILFFGLFFRDAHWKNRVKPVNEPTGPRIEAVEETEGT